MIRERVALSETEHGDRTTKMKLAPCTLSSCQCKYPEKCLFITHRIDRLVSARMKGLCPREDCERTLICGHLVQDLGRRAERSGSPRRGTRGRVLAQLSMTVCTAWEVWPESTYLVESPATQCWPDYPAGNSTGSKARYQCRYHLHPETRQGGYGEGPRDHARYHAFVRTVLLVDVDTWANVLPPNLPRILQDLPLRYRDSYIFCREMAVVFLPSTSCARV